MINNDTQDKYVCFPILGFYIFLVLYKKTIHNGTAGWRKAIPSNDINRERKPPGRQKVVRGSKVPVLTSHAGLNLRSKSGYEPERRVISYRFL